MHDVVLGSTEIEPPQQCGTFFIGDQDLTVHASDVCRELFPPSGGIHANNRCPEECGGSQPIEILLAIWEQDAEVWRG